MSEKHRIVAAMIAGGEALDAEHLTKCLESVSPHVDRIVIAYNGTGAFPLGADFMREHRVSVRKFPWENDFSIARNQSFDMAKECDPDWIIWIDADDVLVDGHQLRPMLRDVARDVTGIFLRYDYLVDDDGEPLIQQWRERVMSTRTQWKWKWPIHEVCHSLPGEHYSRRTDVRIAHQRKASIEDADITRRRNRSLLLKAMREHPEEPRFIYYAANETLAAAQNMDEGPEREDQLKLAIGYYKDFIAKTPWNDDAYLANCNMAEAYRCMGDHNRAMDVDLQSLKLYGTWPHAYIGLANSSLKLGDAERAAWWAQLCLDHCSVPETTQVFEPRLLTFQPYLLRGIGREHGGDIEGALADFRQALSVDPDNDVVLEKIAELESRRGGTGEDSMKVIEDPNLWQSIRTFRFGSRADRSIAFLTTPLFEPWQPHLEAQGGAGGAETCIMRLAPRFVEDGWRVVVFGTPAKPGIEGKVEYYPAQAYDPNEQFHVAVVSRAPEFFDARINADLKLFWMHDVNVGPDLVEGEWGPRLDRMDAIIGLTQWHIDHMSHLYGIPESKFVQLGNGIELGLYDDWNKGPRDMNKMIYSSSPDRGLDVVLRLWPEIRRINPKAELHIFYGWAAIDKILGTGSTSRTSYLAGFRVDIELAIESLGGEQGGIFWHDRVPQAELARHQMGAGWWIYPTYFCETFCITAIESQAAGMIPLVSDLAALTEVVPNQDLRLGGWPNNKSYGEAFVEMYRRLYEAGDLAWDEIREANRAFAESFSWDNVYRTWDHTISRLVKAKGDLALR